MNYFRSALVIFIVALAALFGAKMGKRALAPKFAEADRSKTETGKYILFNPEDLNAKPGVKTFSFSGSKQIEGLNAYLLDFDPSTQPQIMNVIPKGWVLQKEYVHHIFPFSCSRCEQIPCPNPSPSPTPGPTPEPGPSPNPVPIEADRSWGRAKVHAKEAQALVDTSNVKVCVVDTGIDLNHPNKGVVLATQDYTGKGSVQDGNGHGTHTAGTVGGLGGIGVSRAKLLICKGLSDQGSGSSSALAQCLTWCGSQGAQVVSNSWGSSQSDPLINQAITSLTQKGIYVFVANGNDGGAVNWPARLAGSNPLVFAIAASDQSDRISSFSSRGPETRYIAPGSGINSNWPGGGLRVLDGTSMATPHAAGICAFGIAKGTKPCVKFSGQVGGYNFGDALATVQ